MLYTMLSMFLSSYYIKLLTNLDNDWKTVSFSFLGLVNLQISQRYDRICLTMTFKHDIDSGVVLTSQIS